MSGAAMPLRAEAGPVAGADQSGDDGAARFQAATGVSRETIDRLSLYVRQLERWQRAINLVGRGTLGEIWERHLLDSAQLLPLLPPESGPLVDLGSGAGFPGLVLAILGVPDVHLIESDARKSVFLTEIARLTGANVTIRTARIQDLPAFPARAVTARALAPLPDLLALAYPFFAPATVGLFLKGRDWRRELTLAEEAWTMGVRCIPSIVHPDSVILRLESLCHVSAG